MDRRTAEVVLAEIGPDMARFPSSAAHLASWAGVCPGNHESAGTHSSGRTRQGLQVAADRAGPGGQRRRPLQGHLPGRARPAQQRPPGHHKAIVAVAHSILVIIWHLLVGNQPYPDLGAGYVVQRHHSEADKHRLIRQLERLRYKVTLEPVNPA